MPFWAIALVGPSPCTVEFVIVHVVFTSSQVMPFLS